MDADERQPLFLDESDDDSQDWVSVSKVEKPSFFAEDDEEISKPSLPNVPLKRPLEDDDSDIEILEPAQASRWRNRSPLPPPSSSAGSVPQSPINVDDDDVVIVPQPPTKRRRLSSPDVVPVNRLSIDPPGESEKRVKVTATSTYLGELVLDDAWATCSGKGLVSAEDILVVHRDARSSDGGGGITKSFSKIASKRPSGKQMKLTSMFKEQPRPVKTAKKGADDYIVRLSNRKGQELGRLPNRVASWVSNLLDNAIIRVVGSVIDCPSPLRTGSHLIISLRFYFLPTAFSVSVASGASKLKDPQWLSEGSETVQEKMISSRKSSLLQLFKALSLQPESKKTKIDADAIAFTKDSQNKVKSKGKEKAIGVIEDGEETEEVEAEGEELSNNQLNVIYQKAQLHDQEMAEMDPSNTFALTLRPYQRQALRWMFSIENNTKDARQATSMHPLWEEYEFPVEPAEGIIDLCEDEEKFYFNPYSGELSLEFPVSERSCRGGILADEMGMGKTIQISSLIHTNSKPDISEIPGPGANKPAKVKQATLGFKTKITASTSKGSSMGPAATLIVAPLSLLAQWKSELERSSKDDSLKVFIYHGTSRGDVEGLVDPDGDDPVNVVIISYGTLASEHSKILRGGESPLYEVEWLRVVLDEAHFIKSRHTKTAKSCYALRARRRWCLTGTPIVNRLEDLHSLLHFLRDEPWSDFAFFKSCITTPFLNQDPKCLQVVQVVLESILLRREKTMKDKNGNPIVALPPKELTTEKLQFSPAERKIYDSIYKDAKFAYNAFSAGGTVGKNMSNILVMLMRLRRAVLHPSLIQSKATARSGSILSDDAKEEEPDVDQLIARFSTAEPEGPCGASRTYPLEVLNRMEELENEECPLCLDKMQDPVLIPECHHSGCKECIVEHLQNQQEKGRDGFCPVCQRQPVDETSLIEVISRLGAEGQPSTILRKNDFSSSTKLDALKQRLLHLRQTEPSFKAIVFSQFTGFLDLIEATLQREGFAHYRLDGQLSQQKRTQVLKEFAEPSDEPKVFAISLKAGGVGLNLTSANYVFMMDCWWNSAVESQAIDRIHRIGQEKTVYVTHFIISNTIEERIIAIQKRKTAIVKGALGGGKPDKEAFENLNIMFADM